MPDNPEKAPAPPPKPTATPELPPHSTTKSKVSSFPVLATLIWLGTTILYIAIVFLLGAVDWGDSLYGQNPALQQQDKMSAAFQVGLASGLYLPAVVWLILRGTTKYPVRSRIIAAIAVLAVSALVVIGIGSQQVDSINDAALYIQH